MTDIKNGANYAPTTNAKKVVGDNAFCFAAAFLDHGHIYGQCNGLRDAGATLKYVYEPDFEKRNAFLRYYPGVAVVERFEDLLRDPELRLITSAAIPDKRTDIGVEVLESGKDYFTDKPPFTTLAQLETVKKAVRSTARKYAVYYAERLHNDAAWKAGKLIDEGAIGKVLHVTSLAPHRLAKSTRPSWFFDRKRYGGILTDLGSHQIEQFLTYANATDAKINFARVENFCNTDTPGLDDFGEVSLTANNGAAFYSRVDWFTPGGLRTWGDGRTFIMGSEGSIELRKYIDLAGNAPASDLYLVDGRQEHKIDCYSKTGFPFFGELILDCVYRTERAMTQAHCFKAAELSLKAQLLADSLKSTK